MDKSKAVPTIHANQSVEMVPPSDETPRTAVKKRESARICMEYAVQEESSLSSEEQDLQSCEELRSSKPLMITRGTQTRKFRPRFQRPLHRSRGIQTLPEEEIETSIPAKRKKTDFPMVNDVIFSDSEASESESSDEDLDSEADESYHPDTNSDSYYSDSETESGSTSATGKFEAESSTGHKEPKYIVFHNQLLLLLSICLACFSKNVVVNYAKCGGMLTAYIKCLCCKSFREWKSQPDIAGIPMGNNLLSGAILYSGSLPRKFLGGLKSINLACISRETFFRHQRQFLQMVIQSSWILQCNLQFTEIQGTDVVIGGDGRCDSMGHSAKYGSYTAVNLETNKILNVEIIQSNQVKSPNHMELKGLQETLTVLDQFKIKIKSLVTDRHKQIAKWLRDHRPDIEHFLIVGILPKVSKKRFSH